MARIENDVLKRIHSGKCVILVGSGASIDSGYPSWRQMVEELLKINQSLFKNDEKEALSRLISKTRDDLLTVLDKIESKIGKKEITLQVKNIFSNVSVANSDIYSVITKWPIPYYLTTNYDSEIKKYLRKINEIYLEKINTEEDFRGLTSTSNKEIYKIHGDFSNYETIIITKNDYTKIRNHSNFKYWREKIKSILMVSDIILIGYSASDPDFQDQLEFAKEYSNPNKPIYMFASDIPRDEIVRLRLRQNIKIIPYDNRDGNHSALKTLLHNYDHFIPKRNSSLINRDETLLKETELASSMFIFNDTFFHNNKIVVKALYNRILHLLCEGDSLSSEEIITQLQENKVYYEKESIVEAINNLINECYLEINENKIIKITDKGKEVLEVAKYNFNDYKKRFSEYCKLILENKGLSEVSIEKISKYLDNGLVIMFRKRGIEIAKKVISDEDVDLSATFDIADCLTEFEKDLIPDEYGFYIDLLFDVLEKPSKEIRDYLALLCNGYFIYHVLGHEENARQQRLDFIKKNKIYLDSSILLPLLAKECQNNQYAKDLILKIRKLNTELYITHNLLQEVIEHASWAIRNYGDKTVKDFSFYTNLLGIGNKKDNLFVEGGINWLNRNSYMNFQSYIEFIFGENYKNNLNENIEKMLIEYGIRILDKDGYDNFKDEYFFKFEEFKDKIKKDRISKNSFRSELQCDTESELLVISLIEPINFLTHTTNLKQFDELGNISHWYPESIYRFIQMNDVNVNLDDLYNCMISGLYTCGIKSINKEDIEKIINPFIHQAELRLDEIRRNCNQKMNDYFDKKLIEQEKANYTLPFYTSQLEYLLSENLKKENEIILIRTKQLEKETKKNQLTSKERIEYERMKQKKQIKQKKLQSKHKNKGRKRK